MKGLMSAILWSIVGTVVAGTIGAATGLAWYRLTGQDWTHRTDVLLSAQDVGHRSGRPSGRLGVLSGESNVESNGRSKSNEIGLILTKKLDSRSEEKRRK